MFSISALKKIRKFILKVFTPIETALLLLVVFKICVSSWELCFFSEIFDFIKDLIWEVYYLILSLNGFLLFGIFIALYAIGSKLVEMIENRIYEISGSFVDDE